eukprot:403369747
MDNRPTFRMPLQAQNAQNIKLRSRDFENLQVKVNNEFNRSMELISKQKNESAMDKQIEERLIAILNHIKSSSGGNQRFFSMIDKIKKNINWKDIESVKDELEESAIVPGSNDSQFQIQARPLIENNLEQNSLKNNSQQQIFMNQANQNSGQNANNQQNTRYQQFNAGQDPLKISQQSSMMGVSQDSNKISSQSQMSLEIQQQAMLTNLQSIEAKVDTKLDKILNLLTTQNLNQSLQSQSQTNSVPIINLDSITEKLETIQKQQQDYFNQQFGFSNLRLSDDSKFSNQTFLNQQQTSLLAGQHRLPGQESNISSTFTVAGIQSSRTSDASNVNQTKDLAIDTIQEEQKSNNSSSLNNSSMYAKQRSLENSQIQQTPNDLSVMYESDGINQVPADQRPGQTSASRLSEQYNNDNKPPRQNFNNQSTPGNSFTQGNNIQSNQGSDLSTIKQAKFKPGQKQLALFRNTDGKIIVGQNDPKALIFNEKIEFLNEIDLGSELISIIINGDLIYCGLSSNEIRILNEQTFQQVEPAIKTTSAVQKFEIISGAYENYLLLCEKDGYLELLSLDSNKIIYTKQHSSKFSIQDSIKVQSKQNKYNEFALGLAHLENGSYKRGQLSFIRVTIGDDEKIIELEDETQFRGLPVFCMQQVSASTFVVCIIDENFKIYNRQSKTISNIPNPSKSINYNCLQKIIDFGPDCPLMIYKDSRSIGVINCKTMKAEQIVDVSYKRCGNLFAMEQYIDDNDKINIITLLFDGQTNERAIKNYELQIR